MHFNKYSEGQNETKNFKKKNVTQSRGRGGGGGSGEVTLNHQQHPTSRVPGTDRQSNTETCGTTVHSTQTKTNSEVVGGETTHPLPRGSWSLARGTRHSLLSKASGTREKESAGTLCYAAVL